MKRFSFNYILFAVGKKKLQNKDVVCFILNIRMQLLHFVCQLYEVFISIEEIV